MSNTPLVIERILDAPVNAVWEAITDKDKMKQWYFDLSAFSPTVGFEFSFSGGSETKQYLHHCKITEVIPGGMKGIPAIRKLPGSWRQKAKKQSSR